MGLINLLVDAVLIEIVRGALAGLSVECLSVLQGIQYYETLEQS